MLKTFISFLVIGIVILSAAQPAVATDPCEEISMDTILSHAPVPSKAEIISKKNTNGICEIILDIAGEPVALYVSKDFIIAGEMFSKKVQVTRESYNSIGSILSERKLEMTKKQAMDFLAIRPKLDNVAGITYTPKGKQNHILYMISSPSCPYCNKAAKEIQPILDKTGTQLKVIFQADGPAGEKAAQAVCKKVDLQTYSSGTWQSSETGNTCTEGIELVKASTSLAQKLGIRGVPTFFLEDGTQVVGANMAELEKKLSL